jgi:hypothetical protein
MSALRGVQLLCVAILGWGTPGARDAARGETAGVSSAATVATELRESHRVSFSKPGVFAWLNPARSDDDGNLLFVVVPGADARDLKNVPAPPRHVKTPSDILAVSADGKRTSVLSPRTIPAFADADEITTLGIAIDPSGTLLALVWVPRGEAGGRHYIVSFDKNGGYRSRLEIEPDEIAVGQFEVFGSGDFLLRGQRPYSEGVRVVVMSAGGGDLHDVVSLSNEHVKDLAATLTFSSWSDHFVRGGDGRIYFVPAGEDSVHLIEASGNSQEVFKLAPMPRNRRRLVDLRAAGQRLAAIYFEERPQNKGRHWIAVYDVVLGERLAVYGPASGIPVRYEYSDGQDRFTLLKDGQYLVTVVSP